MAQVQLFKKAVKYEKNGEEKVANNFYIRCGSTLIPIDLKYFQRKDEKGNIIPDANYQVRKGVAVAFASDLPERDTK